MPRVQTIGLCILIVLIFRSEASGQQPFRLPEIDVTAAKLRPKPAAKPKPARGHVAPSRSAIPEAPRPQVATPALPAIDVNKAAFGLVEIGSENFRADVAPDLATAMTRALPGVSRGDQTGNPFQPDFDYRGFRSSPVPGTAQGLAIYQNGSRINETFGDTVNLDLLPQSAVHKMSLVPGDPVYGLNAIGGAIAIEMKDGFNYKGTQGSVTAGSYGRAGASAQAGGSKSALAAYITADAINDAGWRAFSSSSRLRRVYVDVGTKGGDGEFHISFTGADNALGSAVATPVEMLKQNWLSVYTWPQQTRNQLAFLQARGERKLSDTVSVLGNLYFRGFRQTHTDGNTSEAQVCADPRLLCFGDNTTPLLGSNVLQLPNTFGAAPAFGETDRTWTASNSYGGLVQASSTAPLADHTNRFIIGASIDHGRVHFTGNSELGTIDRNLFVNGSGIPIQQPAADLAPIDLRTKNTYAGVYATDMLDLTKELSLTLGGRFNFASIGLQDQLGTALTSDSTYARFNPMAALTYKLRPELAIYTRYSEANRAPTPLELGCSDATHPCLVDAFLVSDPSLKQVVSHTYGAGLRGQPYNSLTWNVGLYRTDIENDIIAIASPISGLGYFKNAARTRRQGFEAGVTLDRAPWAAYANYTFVDATFQTVFTASSPFNPAALNRLITVSPGNHIPAVPAHRFKAGIDYAVSDAWKLGGDLNVIGSQYLIGDESNQNPQLPAYWVLNLHASYKPMKNVEVFGLVQNLFNRHYYAAGTFFDRAAIPFLRFSDPRTFVPGMPLAAYAGVRVSY